MEIVTNKKSLAQFELRDKSHTLITADLISYRVRGDIVNATIIDKVIRKTNLMYDVIFDNGAIITLELSKPTTLEIKIAAL